MGLDYVNLFELMGIEPEESKNKKQPEKKQPKTNSNSSKSKKTAASNKSDEMVTLPVTVYTGYRNPISLSPDDFPGKKEVSLKEVHEFLAGKMEDYPVGVTALQKGKKGLYLIHKGIFMVEKTAIHINQYTKVLLAGINIDISTIMTAEECDVTCDTLKAHFENQFPDFGEVGFVRSAVNNVIIPIFKFPELQEPIKLPVKIGIFGRENITISEDEYMAFKNKKADDENSEEEMDNEMDEGTGSSALTIEKGVLEKMIIEKYPDFDEGHMELQWNEKANMIVVKMAEKKGQSKGTAVETYPTNAILSLLYTKWQLSPEMFGGKERVTKEELRKYIAKDRPEYSEDRTNIMYDEESNIIIVVCTGSRKGALIDSDEEAQKMITSARDVLFEWWRNQNGLYRVEKNRAFLIIAPMTPNKKGEFKMFIPKIPSYMYNIADAFFGYISKKYGTEAMLQLFWDEKNNCYFWYLPEQTVSPTMCDIKRNIYYESRYLLIGDFHSHGSLPAFFSSMDNEDEKGFRLYGVFGGYDKNGKSTSFELRAGTGGYYVGITKQDIFDMKKVPEGIMENILPQFYEEIESKICFLY